MASEYRDEGVPFLRSLNVRPFRFDDRELKYISDKFHIKISKSALKPGDVVVVRTGAPGQCCVIPPELPEANCSDLVIVRPGPRLLGDFACVFINAETSQSFVRSEQVGVAQLHFNVGSMKKAPLSLPALDEQHEIVRRVEALFANADRLEARYQAARAHVDRLTPALLAKAFRGDLVPQDPNDEPASVLLERIRAERVASPKARGARPSPPAPLPRGARGGIAPPPLGGRGWGEGDPSPVRRDGVAPRNIPEAILAHMQPGRDYSRSDLCGALVLSTSEWTWAIRELKESGKVVQEGARRGATYTLAA
ncbi:MAG: restriction endonuclease subunit S [Deltaproteobacteria bacterium]|nr:restriction endonuclease subunit S [Deltaproteobacteria bacterium]